MLALAGVPSAVAGTTWCPIAPWVQAMSATEVSVGFWTPLPAGHATGTVTLWADKERYDVAFRDVAAIHVLGTMVARAPLIVRFAHAVRIRAAAVTSLDNPAPGPCDPLYVPWHLPVGPYSASAAPFFMPPASVADAVVLEAPAPVPYEEPACAVRYAPARTVHPYEPRALRYNGTVGILVTVGTDGRALGVETMRSSRIEAVDAVAKDAAARSTYAPEVFDCRPIIGTYLFTVDFSYNGPA